MFFHRSLAFGGALPVPVGFSMMTQISSTNTLVQAMVSDALRKLRMSVYSMMFMGVAPFGALLAVVPGGLVCLIGALIFGFRLPGLRENGRRMIVSMQMSAGVSASRAAFQPPVPGEQDFDECQ